ncbi:MAG: hypothetical protein RIR10_2117 [Planctomycetota bacterium]
MRINFSQRFLASALATSLSVVLVPLELMPLQSARADELVLTSSADNTLIEDPSGAFSAGLATYFFAGRVGVNGGSTLRRGAIRFDLSTIPPGSTITSVSLKMNCSAVGLTTQYPISLKRFTKSWGEGASQAFGGGGAPSATNDVTWFHRFYGTTQMWATPGGEFVATASATRNVGAMGFYTWTSTAGLVADVQLWVNNPTQNFGWCVVGNETVLQSVKRFDSHEATVESYRPQLTIVYTAAPPNPYDLNGDFKVNAADLATLLSRWGLAGNGDADGSGAVDGADLAGLLGAWTG